MAWTGSSVVITANDMSDGEIDYWWQQAGTRPWNPQQVGTDYSSAAPALACTGTSVVITAPNASGV